MAKSFQNFFKGLFINDTEERTINVDLHSDEFMVVAGSKAKSGVTVTPASSLRLSAVYASVKVYTNDIKSLPRTIIERTSLGRETAVNHDQYYLWKTECNRLYTTSKLLESMVLHYFLWGDGYAKIVRNPNTSRPIRYELRKPWEIQAYLYDDSDGSQYVRYHHSKTGEWIDQKDMIHFSDLSDNGISGKSRIRLHAESLGLFAASRDYGSGFFDGGGIKSKILLTPEHKVDPPAERAIRRTLSGVVSKQENVVGILPKGFTHHELKQNIPNTDAQLLETMNWTIEDVARIFGVPLHRIGNLHRSTNNNIEHQGREWVTYGLLPVITMIEEEVTRKIFKESERGKCSVKINMDGLMRGSIKDQTEHFKSMWDRGVYNADDIRKMKDMNPIENGLGKKRFVPRNFIPIDQIEKIDG